jgi:hypothetical protein
MPTTPRSAIPYPAAGDTPNLPVQMAAISTALEDQAKDDQGPFASRPVSTPISPGFAGRYYYATDRGVVYRDTGTGWKPVNGVEQGTLLPAGAPADYTLFDLLVDEIQGIVWTFRYVSTEATYKWVFVGGPQYGFSQDNSQLNSVASTSYTSLSAEGTAPVKGIYEIEFGANCYNATADSGCALSYTIPGGGAASDNDCVQSQTIGTGVDADSFYAHHHLRRVTKQTATSAGKFALYGKALSAGTAVFRGLFMYIRPIQVAP